MNDQLKPLLARLHPVCRKALDEAGELCLEHQHYSLEIEHWLLTLMSQPGGDVALMLDACSLSPVHLQRQLQQAVQRFQAGSQRPPTLSPHILTLLREAWLHSSLLFETPYIRSAALLMVVLTHETLRILLLQHAEELARFPLERIHSHWSVWLKNSKENQSEVETQADLQQAQAALRQYTLDLCAAAQRGELDRFSGRDSEIRQIIDILSRRRQNNPLLVGEAGVGKTAVVEALAALIASGKVPKSLKNVRICSLDLGLLQAGAGVKGEFENRVKSVIYAVNAAPTPIILFIDEAHMLVGAGGAAGQGDAANLLKPALARGELRTIAATTWDEYKRYFERDPALTRRFQIVKIEEPDEDSAIRMLRGLLDKLEQHHGVKVLDSALRDAVRWSHRYISARQLPDKAVSVLDTACARVAIAQTHEPEVLSATRARIERLEEEHKRLQQEQHPELEAVDAELAQLFELQGSLEQRLQSERTLVNALRSHEARLQHNVHSGAWLTQTAEKLEIQQEINELREQLHNIQGHYPMLPLAVDSHSIAAVIADWTGIPLDRMLRNEIDTILHMRDKLGQQIIAQQPALQSISRRLQSYWANLTDPGKPIGVFLLAGPSGTGKTETAFALAELLYGGERNLICLNMSDYQEAHTVSMLRGAPPGYVGYGQGGLLTEAVRRTPYTVILLDEIEKAHPDVLSMFLPVFDKGILEDGNGVTVDFKNTLILLTTHIGSEAILRLRSQKPRLPELQAAVRQVLVQKFPASLLNRTLILPYQPLEESALRRIVQIKLDKLAAQLYSQHRVQLFFSDKLVQAMTNYSLNNDSGARSIEQVMGQFLLPGLSLEILQRHAQHQPFYTARLDWQAEQGFIYQFDADAEVDNVPEAAENVSTADHLLRDLGALLAWLER